MPKILDRTAASASDLLKMINQRQNSQDGSKKDTDDSAFLPKSGRFYGDQNDERVFLPTYEDIYISPKHVIPGLTDCDRALRGIIEKTRLIGFEIARQRRSLILTRSSGRATLQHKARQLDELLWSIPSSIDTALDCGSLTIMCQHIAWIDTFPTFKLLIGANAQFKRCVDELKRTLLRIEKNFGQIVVEPLKRALIYGNSPVYSTLLDNVRQCNEDISKAGDCYRSKVWPIIEEVQKSAAWIEVQNLGNKITELEEEAGSLGWVRNIDSEYLKLNPSSVFDRADGPSSVISYLEDLLKNPANIKNHPAYTGPPLRPLLTWKRLTGADGALAVEISTDSESVSEQSTTSKSDHQPTSATLVQPFPTACSKTSLVTPPSLSISMSSTPLSNPSTSKPVSSQREHRKSQRWSFLSPFRRSSNSTVL